MTTMQGSPSFEERLDSLRGESQRFADYLMALPPESWNAQSACDLWQVGHVVAHLVGVAEFYATTVERGIEGNFETLPGRAACRFADRGHLSRGHPPARTGRA